MNKRELATAPVKVKRRDDGHGINSGVPPFAARTPQGKPLPKPHKGWPNPRHKKLTHAEKKLQSRRGDYDKTVNQQGWKAPFGSYHKPGSNK